MNSPDDRVASHASELDLHRLALDQLPLERRAAVAAHAGGCARCGDALAAFRGAHAEFDRSVRPRTEAALAARALGRPASRRWLIWLGLTAAPALGLVVLGLGLGGLLSRSGPDLRTKGAGVEPRLELFVKRGDRVWALAPGGDIRPGDAIRFVVRRPPELRHLLVVGVAAGRPVTVYHPWGQTASAALDPASARVELPGSIVADASTGPERVFALFGRQPLALSAVAPALEALAAGGETAIRGAGPLPAAADGQSSILIERPSETPP